MRVAGRGWWPQWVVVGPQDVVGALVVFGTRFVTGDWTELVVQSQFRENLRNAR